MNFWSCRKNGLIRKVRLISKFMTSQICEGTITIDILPNASRSKDNQTMKFGQLIEYDEKNIFLKKPWRKRGRETSFTPLFVFKKALYDVKTSDLELSFNIF